MKISVVGIGKVGSTVSFVLAKDGLASELVLYNRTREIAQAEAIDIQQAVALTNHRLLVRDGDIEDTAESSIIVIAVSVPMPKEMSSRDDLLLGNTKMMQELIPSLLEYSPKAIFINVSNPVDALTYQILQIANRHSKQANWQRVIGTGTLIDSARFRDLLATQLGIHPTDINAYILGEHGDGQFAALSSATCGGEFIDANPLRQQMVEDAKQSAWTIFQAKGYTNYTVSLALEELGVTRKPALRVPYFGAAIHAVQQTLLVATVPQRIAKSYSSYLDIKVVQAPIELDRFRYIMAWHPRLSKDKAHCWLRNTIEQCAISLRK